MKMERFVSGASYWIPESLVESTWTEHAPFAFWLIDAHRPQLLVELGTHNGFSYFAFNQAVKQLGAGTACFAVDTWHGDQQAGFYGPEVFERVREYHDRRYADFSQLLRSTFDDAVGRFQDDTIDLLHIDGRHGYEDVKHDFETWKPKLSNRAIVVFHDTCVFEEGFGVHRLWGELQTRYPHFEFVHGCGLGVLGVGSEVHSHVSELFSASRNSAVTDEIRRIYSRLGYSLAVQNTMVSLSNMVKDKEVHVRNLEALLTRKDDQARNLKSELRGSQAELEGTRSTLRVSEDHLRATKDRLSAMENLVRSQQAKLQTIQNSASWRLVQRFWAWNVHAFPFGTRRRRIYEKTVGNLGSLLLGKGRARRTVSKLPNYGTLSAELPSPGAKSSRIEMNCDQPMAGEQCGGAVTVRGWAVAPRGVEKVEISLDGMKLAQALYGQLRPDVARDHLRCKDSQNSGFLYIWDATLVTDGVHQLTISVYSREGDRREMTVPVVVDHSLTTNLYNIWTQLNEPTPEGLQDLAAESKTFTYRPKVSVVVPVYRTPPKLVREAIESVRAQVYDNWEMCLVDDASKRPELSAILKEYAGQDTRIRLTDLAKNRGIAGATNAALALAQGEFVGFLDHDDTLGPDALYRVVKHLQHHRDADLIYSDEDKLDPGGERFDPFCKPDWSPDLLLAMNYICHFVVIRRNLLEEVGGLRCGFDGAQDYDLVLRITEKTDRIHHLPHVLYHWRQLETSTAASAEAKPQAKDAAKRAITEHLARKQVVARVEPGVAIGRWRVRYEITEHPKVTVVLPTGGRLELLRPCLESLFSTTDYPNYDIVLVDNSKGSDVNEYVTALANPRITYVDYRNRPFNYSALNNFAVQQTQAPLVLFLNDDTTIVRADWLSALVEHGQRPSVGVVGAKLVYPFGLIQHAGVVMGIFENTAHAFRNLPADSRTYFDFPQIVRNCSAVTAACMLTRRKLFLDLGGFNETRLAVAFQDVDYCLRVRQAGLFIVYTPHSMLIHHESVTKDEKLGNPKEVRYMQQQWAEVIANDPFYSPNLTRKAEDYSLRMD